MRKLKDYTSYIITRLFGSHHFYGQNDAITLRSKIYTSDSERSNIKISTWNSNADQRSSNSWNRETSASNVHPRRSVPVYFSFVRHKNRKAGIRVHGVNWGLTCSKVEYIRIHLISKKEKYSFHQTRVTYLKIWNPLCSCSRLTYRK